MLLSYQEFAVLTVRSCLSSRKGIQIVQKPHRRLLIGHGAAARLLVSAAAVLHGNGVDVEAVGAEFAMHAVVALGEVHPDEHVLDVAHEPHEPRRDCGRAVRTRGDLLARGVDIGDVVCGKLNFVHVVGLLDDLGEVLGIQVVVEGVEVDGLRKQECRRLEGARRGGIEGEPPAVRHHAHVEVGRGAEGEFELAFLREVGDHAARALEGALDEIDVAHLFGKDVMIEAQRLFGERIAFVADHVDGAAVEDDGERTLVIFVGDLVHLRLEEGEPPCLVSHDENFFFGKVVLDELSEPELAAHGVPVGIAVAVDDDAVVLFDEL